MPEDTSKLIAGLDLPKARPQHYSFAYQFLPWLAFNKPDEYLSLGVDIPKNVLKDTWDRAGNQYPPNERVASNGLKGEQVRYNKHVIVLITLPTPKTTAEAFFVGMVFTKQWINDLINGKKSEPVVRCFILSKNKEDATLREKTKEFHGGIEYGLSPDRDTFLIKVGDQIKDTLEGAPAPQPTLQTKGTPTQSLPIDKKQEAITAVKQDKSNKVDNSPIENVECSVLMDVANPKLYRRNSFRITGLPVDASTREIARHADKLKVLDQIGYGHAANPMAFPVEPLPSLDQVREAMQTLKDPEKRIIDEFFWFWPESFGESAKDEALQALAQGDGGKAFEIWTSRKSDPTKTTIAYHNLAVLMHMLALDWTRSYIDSEPDEEAQQTIKDYWSKANRYWNRTIESDSIWDAVKSRIRSMDDDRVTTGFGRRVRTLLPDALCLIHASLALKYTERGKHEFSDLHVEYIQQIASGSKQYEKAFDTILAPSRKRLIQAAKALDLEQNTARRLELASTLSNQAVDELNLFENFYGAASEHYSELFNQVSQACVDAINTYANELDITEGCVEVLRSSLAMARDTELQQRISQFIDLGEKVLRRSVLQPFLDNFKVIAESKESPTTKLAEVKVTVMPQVMAWMESQGPKSKLSDDLLDEVSRLLRAISIEAFNTHDDTATSLEATTLAQKLARSEDLKKRISEDYDQLKSNETEEIKARVRVRIRSDDIEIDRNFFRVNKQTFPVAEITGVRHGGFRGQNLTSYFIAVCRSNDAIKIECKRAFRSEAQAKRDYDEILRGLYANVVPRLSFKIAQNLASGGTTNIGDLVLSRYGVTIKGKFLRYDQISFDYDNGELCVVVPLLEAHDLGLRASINDFMAGRHTAPIRISVRNIWNAVIYEQITKAVKILSETK
jgi:hypothetical protein